jgi:Planctomycete cytochrome C
MNIRFSMKPFDLLRLLSETAVQPNMNPGKRIVLLGAMGLSLAAFAKDVDLSKLPPASSQQGVTFDKDIKPIFDHSCVKCHSGEKPKGKLHLDSLAGVLKGGEDKVVEPGESTKSMLIINVAHLGDEDDWMPPPNNKMKIPALTNEQIGLIRAWIDQGAK